MLRTRLVAGVTSGLVLSTVFATALTVAAYVDAFVEPWRVDPAKPAPVTLRIPTTQVQTEDEDGTLRFVHLRATIRHGQLVTQEPLATLVRTYERARRPPDLQSVGAQWLLYFLVFMVATTYMRSVSTKTAGLLRTQVGLLGLGMVVLLGGKVGLLATWLPATTLPLYVVPLWTALYIDRRTALTLGAAMTLCASSLVGYDVTTTVVYLVGAATCALLFRFKKQTSMLVVVGLAAGLASALAFVATRQLAGGFDLTREMARSYHSEAFMALCAPVASGLLAFLTQPLISRLLGIVSRSRLLDLSDLDQPLLQKMQRDAPGSWEHSRMMANLAEAAASAIGGDTLLTRVGAYYHDLGKSVQPKYFVENLVGGEESPHKNLEPHVSADAIMAHVVEGVRILRDGGVPEPVVEFAYTHHGTSVIEYFWHKHQQQEGGRELTEDAFRYPGMRPRTRETGILMLIDAIEAGARTVDPPTREGFEELVRRVIFTKLQQGQLDDTGLSLQDLRICVTRITDSLCSAYHSRIKYPWQERRTAADATPTETAETGDRTTPTGDVRPEAKSKPRPKTRPSDAEASGETKQKKPRTGEVEASGEAKQKKPRTGEIEASGEAKQKKPRADEADGSADAKARKTRPSDAEAPAEARPKKPRSGEVESQVEGKPSRARGGESETAVEAKPKKARSGDSEPDGAEAETRPRTRSAVGRPDAAKPVPAETADEQPQNGARQKATDEPPVSEERRRPDAGRGDSPTPLAAGKDA